MTIEEHFRRQALISRLFTWVGWVVAFYLLLTHHERSSLVERYGWGCVVGVTTIAFTMLIVAARSRCPQCGGDLRQAASQIAHGRKVLACPHCGVSFDSPWS
jgi:hypothetical protein